MCFWCVGSTCWKSTRQSEVLMAFLWPLVDLLHLRPQGQAVPDWAPISHCVRPPGFHFTPSSWWMVPPCTPPPPPTHQRPPNSEPRLPWAWATHLKPPTNNTILRQPSKGHASYGNLPWSNQSWASYISYIVCLLLSHRGGWYPIWFNSMFEFWQKMIHSIFDSILLHPRFNSKYYSIKKKFCWFNSKDNSIQ